MQVKEIAPGVFATIGPETTSNTGFILGREGVLAIDTMMVPSLTREMLAEMRSRTTKPVRLIINTHFHGDHIFGNQFFTEAVIASHERARRTMLEQGEGLIEDILRFRPEIKDELKDVRVTPPTLTYPDGMTIYWDGRRVEISNPGTAHTDGDSLVYVPEEQVLFTGDLLFSGVFRALLPRSSIQGWIRALTRLTRLPVTTIVPGHGPMSTPAHLQNLRRLLVLVRREVARCRKQGMTRDETMESVRMNTYAAWERPQRSPGSVVVVYDEKSMVSPRAQ